MISTVTAVLQVNSGPLRDKVFEIEENKELIGCKLLDLSLDFYSRRIIDLILALIEFLISIVEGLINFVLELFSFVDLIE